MALTEVEEPILLDSTGKEIVTALGTIAEKLGEIIPKPKYYGISRALSSMSTAWKRTGAAEGLTATASVGTTAGHSDFDSIYPWSDMKRTVLPTGDVMVRIPVFYYKRYVEAGEEHIEIAAEALEGFIKHPGSGCYVGAYKTSSNDKSVSGAEPTVSQTRATMRTNARAKGSGWGLIDEVTHSAIRMLYLVEFADSNSQAKIGRGWVDGNSEALNTGSCDALPITGIYLTGRPAGTDGKTGVIYRGIEDFWGNIWEFTDGLNVLDGQYYVCTDPSKYADNTTDGYISVGYAGSTGWNASYITKNGIDPSNPWVELPIEAGVGSETTGYADVVWSASGWRVARRSGDWNSGSLNGAWTLDVACDSSRAGTAFGSRLHYLP